MTVRILPAAMLTLFLLFGCDAGDQQTPQEDDSSVSIPFRKDGELSFTRPGTAPITIDIEIAETDSARTRGLMQRKSLPELSGMLFIFPREETQSFWMANTPLALDIIFVSADSQIVDIKKYTRPFSTQSISSAAPARYVIEVSAGFADTHGLTAGDRVTWHREGQESPS